MLWQKESNNEGALFVDLFKPDGLQKFEQQYWNICRSVKLELDDINYIESKSDELSVEYRQTGNSWFGNDKLELAMRNYNLSLCAAENDSVNIAFSFANRAKCFFHMKRYENCLIDIELAINNGYENISKLEKIKADCLKMMKKAGSADRREEKLGYPPNKQFPGMANVLQFESNPEYGRHVTATTNIDIGKTVLFKNIYFGEVFVTRYEMCAICLKSNTNLVPCTKCTFYMVCYGDSQCKIGHWLECGIMDRPLFGDVPTVAMLMPVIRSILKINHLFPNTDDLMEFVNDAINSDQFEIPSFTTEQSTYRAFLKVSTECDSDFKDKMFFIYKAVMSRPKIVNSFSTEKHQRFLPHLIKQHMDIFIPNLVLDKVALIMPNVIALRLTASVYCFDITKSYFNHSCYPNIVIYFDNGHVIGKVIRPIKKGEQLCASYHPFNEKTSTVERQTILHAKFKFLCKCERCRDPASDSRSILELTKDPDFKFVKRNFKNSQTSIVNFAIESDRKRFENKTFNFLKKYGHSAWCEEIGLMKAIYARSLLRWTSSPFNKFHYLIDYKPTENNYFIPANE